MHRIAKRLPNMSDEGGSPKPEEPPAAPTEHLNIKVTDNNNEVFFKIKRTTALKKLMDAFCDRSGKTPGSVRFLFDGQRVAPGDTPETVSEMPLLVMLQLQRPFPSLASGEVKVPSERRRTQHLSVPISSLPGLYNEHLMYLEQTPLKSS